MLFDLLDKCRELNPSSGGVYATADLSVLLDHQHPSRLAEAIRTLIREGLLLRVRRGLYVDRLNGYKAEIVGQRWIAPSYLSTESALDRHGLCETGIAANTFVTPHVILRSEHARRRLEGHHFIYRHLARHLFFGYRSVDGLWLAEPEKAVIDFLYYHYRKQVSAVAPEDIDFSAIDPRRYRRSLAAFRQIGFAEYALGWLRKRGGHQ